MKYNAPQIINQHSALSTILGGKGVQPAFDSGMDQRTTAPGYESDE